MLSPSEIRNTSLRLKLDILLCVCVSVAFALAMRLRYFSIGLCTDRECKRHASTSLTHPIPAVLKPVYGVTSLAALKGGYGSANAQQTQTQMHERIHVRLTVNATLNTNATQRNRIKLLLSVCFALAASACINVWPFIAPLTGSCLLSHLL